MNSREIREAKGQIDALLEERRERMQFVRQAPTPEFRAFSAEQVAAVDRQIAEIRDRLKREAWGEHDGA